MPSLKQLRVIVTSMAAAGAAIFTIARTGRGGPGVVLAWFPKAFTGGCMMECDSIGSSFDCLQTLRALRVREQDS